MVKETERVAIILSLLVYSAGSTPLPQSSPDKNVNTTIEDIVHRQTDTIKQIVNDQQQQTLNYPTVAKYPTPDKEEKTQPEEKSEKLTLEELKVKCQHLAQLAAGPSTQFARPTYNHTNHNYNTKLQLPKPGNIRPIGFYITSDGKTRTRFSSTTTTTPRTVATSPKPIYPQSGHENVKLIKLEPVILIKTILNDGRVIYNWHKNLPSSVQVSYPDLDTGSTTTTTTTTTTPASTTASSGYDFRYFFPSFYSSGGAESADSTSTEKATTAHSTVSAATEDPDRLNYKQQLKFVIPVPYTSPGDPVVKKPGDFDPYAYYPRPLQPQTVNMEVPYVPTFHVINALMVPKKFQQNKTLTEPNY